MALTRTLVEFFVIGLTTPLTAACALPLYPGFVVYLSNQPAGAGGEVPPDAAAANGGSGERGDAGAGADGGYSPALLGTLVVAGVVAFMLLVGLLFSAVLGESLTAVVEVVSPAAFAVLALVSVALILDLEAFSKIPTVDPPQTRHPALTALGYGFFFGAIVLPCNPGLLAFFLARQFLVTAPVEKLLSFLAFGLGMGTPLLALALVSESLGKRFTRALARHRVAINRAAGAVMLVVSAYYLLAVFDVFGVGSALGV